MKKIRNIMLTAAVALAFSACDDVDLDKGIPSVTPQQPIMPADGITAVDMVANDGVVNLETADNGFVDMINVTRLENFPADQSLKIVMNVSATQDMASVRNIDLNVIPGTEAGSIKVGRVDVNMLDEAVKALVSRDPTAQAKLYVNYVAYAVQGTSTVLLGSVGTPQSILVKPLSYEHPVETTYYIYGTATDGSIANAIQLAHEGNQYDNPVFKVKIDITSAQINADGGWKFKVIPESTKQAGQTWEQNHNLTFIGAGEDEGTLAYATATEDCQWIVINKPGQYMLNVNVLDQTWELSNAIEYMYVPGDGNGWSWATQLYTNNYINYLGFANLKGSFKFTGTAGWNSDLGNYGAGADNNKLQNGSNTNFTVEGTPGLYWLDVNLAALEYKKTYIEKVGVVGSHNGWNAGGATALTPSEDNLIWEGLVTFSDTDEFKFCMNGGWDINLGGVEDNLEFNNSKNLTSPGAGTYLVVLDLSALPYQAYFEEQ